MKQPMRYFSIGLLTASVILLLSFYFFDNSTTGTDDLPVEEMIEAIKADGYHVVSEKEYIALSVNDEDDNKANDKKEDKDKNEEDKKQEEESDKKTYTINIKSGMLPSEISEILAENDIIKDADKFDQYLEKEEYSPYIQLGKHKLNSEMSTKEVAEALTK
ncbi:MAG TPA: hypothetical protein VK091_00470 [Virgibacillus sp.]|nr:hypothetical protein [Virgibacillus sp.]